MTLEIDFPHGGNLKSILELLLRAVIKASQPQVGESFSLLLRPFRPSSIAFEMPDGWGNCPPSSPHRPDLWLFGVSLTPFYLLSARLDQDDVAYAEAKLPQNILPAWQGEREFIYFV